MVGPRLAQRAGAHEHAGAGQMREEQTDREGGRRQVRLDVRNDVVPPDVAQVEEPQEREEETHLRRMPEYRVPSARNCLQPALHPAPRFHCHLTRDSNRLIR